MKKQLCLVLLAASFLLVILAGASSAPLTSNRGGQQAQVLGRRGRELGQLGYHFHHEGKGIHNSEEVVMEVKKPAEKKADLGWTDQGQGGTEKRPVFSADYEGVAVHAGSPPKRKHPKP